MDENIFQDCYEQWSNKGEGQPFWSNLAYKYGFVNGEVLRNVFKRERKNRGIVKHEAIPYNNEIADNPRVAIVDIEMLPMLLLGWGLFEQNLGIDQIVSDACLLGWAGKFLNEPDIFSDILTSKEAIKRDPKRIVSSCWNFLSKTNVLIGHNFLGFDNKLINTAFLLYDLPPLKFTIIDTLLVAKQNFRFSSNKLKFINQKLEIRNKYENEGFPLWKSCHQGDAVALQTMLEYNIGDIFATEELFYKIRPYVRNFNVALYNSIDKNICPVCGSSNLNTEGFYYTSAGKWQSVRCNDCKCISRKKENLLGKNKKKALLINS